MAGMPLITITQELLKGLKASQLSERAIFGGVIALLASRSMNARAMAEAILQVRQDSLLPLATAVLGSCLTSWLFRSSMRNTPTELTGDCVAFVDVYAKERVIPRTYMDSKMIFMGFLKTHYEKTSAEQFIADGQYSLCIRSQSGGSPVPWGQPKGALWGWDGLLLMAILYRVSSRRCLECLNMLKPQRSLFTW